MPLALGMEAAGVVEAVGEGVSHLALGDRAAYASQPPGAYCDVRVMPAKCVVRLPDEISFETGAAMMLKGLTVQYLLKKTLPAAGLQRGDFILFHAAAGGVGLIACQWARELGPAADRHRRFTMPSASSRSSTAHRTRSTTTARTSSPRSRRSPAARG